MIKVVKLEYVTPLVKALQSLHFPEEAVIPPHMAFPGGTRGKESAC